MTKNTDFTELVQQNYQINKNNNKNHKNKQQQQTLEGKVWFSEPLCCIILFYFFMLHYFKCPVYNKKNETYKEAGKHGP